MQQEGCNHKLHLYIQVSIPQAVGTVATAKNITKKTRDLKVSIPQAVGTVATNQIDLVQARDLFHVSIPQAVGTVATDYKGTFENIRIEFQYRKR